jgi:hypothetical protein
LAEAKREIERVVDSIARGILSDEEARCRLVEPRRRREQAEAELAQLKPPPKTVMLHPGIIERYLAAVDDLAGTLGRRIVEGNEECAAALRELVVAVIVLSEQHRAEPRIEVQGQLSRLTGEESLFPQRIVPPTLVAGAGPPLFNSINDLAESGTRTPPIVSQGLFSRRSHRPRDHGMR